MAADCSSSTPRRLYVLRHAERVDYVFRNWIETCFDADDNYKRLDLNMPKSVPKRATPNDWILDGPITNIGRHQAKLVGEHMMENEVKIDCVYTSPALRCVQTADIVLTELGLREKLKLRIEPGLYELTGFLDFPVFFTPEALANQGFNIDLSHKPHLPIDAFKEQLGESFESIPQLYARNVETTKSVIANSSGNVLIVAHNVNIETCTRFLTGNPERNWADLKLVLTNVCLCSLVALEKCCNDDMEEWQFIDPPSAPVTCSNNNTFDWKLLL